MKQRRKLRLKKNRLRSIVMNPKSKCVWLKLDWSKNQYCIQQLDNNPLCDCLINYWNVNVLSFVPLQSLYTRALKSCDCAMPGLCESPNAWFPNCRPILNRTRWLDPCGVLIQCYTLMSVTSVMCYVTLKGAKKAYSLCVHHKRNNLNAVHLWYMVIVIFEVHKRASKTAISKICLKRIVCCLH